MNDNQTNEDTVTINDAIEQVKKWVDEKDYEKAKQGCEEILTVQPDNTEIKALLQAAEDGLKPKSETGPKTEAEPKTGPEAGSFSLKEKEVAAEPVMTAAQITPPVTPAMPTEPPAMPTAKVGSAAKPGMTEPIVMPNAMPATPIVPKKPKKETSPMDIFAKPAESLNPKTETNPLLKEKKTELGKPAVKTGTEMKEPKGKGTIIVLIGGIIIITALGVSIYMGFLNPLFDAILNLLGM